MPAGPDRACSARFAIREASEQSSLRRLASIPGPGIGLRFPESGRSAWREAEPQLAVLPPGDREFEVGEAGVDQDGVVAAQVQRAGDAGVVDVQGAGGVKEVPPDPLWGGGLVAG